MAAFILGRRKYLVYFEAKVARNVGKHMGCIEIVG